MNAAFKTHLLNPEGVQICRGIGEAFDGLLKAMPTTGDARHLAIMKTHLEDACFRAKKSIAVQPQYQLTPETP